MEELEEMEMLNCKEVPIMGMEQLSAMGMEHQAVKRMDQHTPSQQNLNVSCPFFILAITARFMRFTGDGCSDFYRPRFE